MGHLLYSQNQLLGCEANATNERVGIICVIDMLSKMLEKNVRPDMDTLQYYCMPLCDSTVPKQLMSRLQSLGLTVRELLTPLLVSLVKQDKTDLAVDLFEEYNVPIYAERLLQPLVRTWNFKKDPKNVMIILKKMSASAVSPLSQPIDCVGQFLIRTFKCCRTLGHYKDYLNLIEGLQAANINITSTAADSLMYWIKQSEETNTYLSEMESVISKLGSTSNGVSYIPHPRDMSISELEGHLVELTIKGMETRGTLRLLIQRHCQLGNGERALELRSQLISKRYEESPGMKTAIMHIHVTSGDMDSALNMYFSIKKEHPNFVIDDFKLIDLATILVKNKQFDQAVSILTLEAKNRKALGRPNPSILRNCLDLIGSGQNEVEVQKLFQLIVDKGYCKPSNIILGPLVKIQLNQGNLEKAVSVFKNCTETYHCTPLQLELLCALVKAEKHEMLQDVLNYVSKVHGDQATVIPCIAAFAQNGRCSPLKKLLEQTSVVSKYELEKRIERWVNEKNVLALTTLAAASHSLRSSIVDKATIYHSIMKIHSTNNDCPSAISFYRDLTKQGKSVPQNISDELLRLVQRCQYEVPEDLH